jgi:hypothetical protein
MKLKQAERELNPPSSAEVKNSSSFTSIPAVGYALGTKTVVPYMRMRHLHQSLF